MKRDWSAREIMTLVNGWLEHTDAGKELMRLTTECLAARDTADTTAGFLEDYQLVLLDLAFRAIPAEHPWTKEDFTDNLAKVLALHAGGISRTALKADRQARWLRCRERLHSGMNTGWMG